MFVVEGLKHGAKIVIVESSRTCGTSGLKGERMRMGMGMRMRKRKRMRKRMGMRKRKRKRKRMRI
jgi:hypothetical protein